MTAAPEHDAHRVDHARRRRLYPAELLAITFVLSGVVLLERLPVTYPRSALFLAYASPVVLIAGIAMIVTFWRRRRHPQEEGWADELYTLGRAILPILVVFPVAFLLKSFIFLINKTVWDRQLLQLDAALHFGFSPTIFLTTLLGEPLFLRIIDTFYTAVYYLIFVGYTATFLALLPRAQRLRFAHAFVVLWMSGSVLYLLLPSWGPAFVATHLVEEALEHMPRTVAVQSMLYEELSSLVNRPLEPRVVRLGCVAAFPSLHVGMMSLFALVSRQISRRWFHLNLFLVVLMIVGSVVTGYHYALDGYAGAALAVLAWGFTKRSFAEPTIAIAPAPDQNV